MKAARLALCLIAGFSASAWSESEFQIQCPGRPVMTVSRAQYGLSTLYWPKQHFQIAAGQLQTRTDNGDKVAITRFRNGDQLIVNKSNLDTFFVYHDSDDLIPCRRTTTHEVDALSLERYDDRQRNDS